MTDQNHGTSGPGYGIPPGESRLPAQTRLGPVRLQVGGLQRSLAYYQEVLGFQVAHQETGLARLSPKLSSGVSPELSPGGEDTTLVELREEPGAPAPPDRGRLGLFHFAILLPTRGDLARFLRHLAEGGVHPGASDHHVSEALYLRDPDGLGIEVYADRPAAAWQTRGRELRMETAPLDTSGLLRQAGDAPWTGLPPGTTMGHVHLHVGDLTEAEAFYHQALGLDKVVWSYPGALFLSAGGYHHHLGLNVWAGPRATPPPSKEARLLEWTILLPSAQAVAAAARHLEKAGYPADQSTDEEFVTRDPWGTRLRIGVTG